ncbi:leucine-rich repeat domain-containing protein [uncultured Clostridium sp.]|uniref:leucine-rich repeat domain-containing protein n=2 Tax=uncultured Clostridium sp. TaxID=59620 RepID=UPI0025F64AED|nr:leucine-rich repeat domain-containing protein [uncultured Clostridium sp.]
MRRIKRILFMTLNLLIILSPVKGYCGEVTEIVSEENKEIKESNEKESQENTDDNSQDIINSKEIIDEFEVDNVTYKVINDDTVMFYKYKEPEDESSLTVPNYIKYGGTEYKVEYIYEKAFNKAHSSQHDKCMINKIIISDQVKGFCDDQGNKLDRVDSMFKKQSKLESVKLGNIDVQWGFECFYRCESLKSIDIPDNITKLLDSTFLGCSSLEEVNLENIREFKGEQIFEDCMSLKDIGGFNDDVKVLTRSMFTNCINLQITDMNNVIEVEDKCFFNCRKLNDTVVNNLVSIGEESFSGCSSFKSVRFKSVENIGEKAFSNCSDLREMIFEVPVCPYIKSNIDKFTQSNIDKYIFPIEYISQNHYKSFLKNLSIKVTYFFDNYRGKPKTKRLYRGSLDSLFNFKPVDYKLLNWYKDETLTMKVEKAVDTGIIEDGKLIIDNPVIFAECVQKINEGDDNQEESNNGENDDSDLKDDNNGYEERDDDIQDDENDDESSDENLEDDKKDDDLDISEEEDDDDDESENKDDDNIDKVENDKNENKEADSSEEADNNESESNEEEFKDKTLNNNNAYIRRGSRRSSADDNSSENTEGCKIISVEKSRLKPGINRFYILNPLLKNNNKFSDGRWINIYCAQKSLGDKSLNKLIVRYYYETERVETEWTA